MKILPHHQVELLVFRYLMFAVLVLAEAAEQAMEATERLGGQYSTNLHPQCTHLVVQISFNQFFKLFKWSYIEVATPIRWD